MQRVKKVVAYIIRDSRILVFEHRDYPEAGIQVPAGTVGESEDVWEAVSREALEETGLENLRVVRYLGAQEFQEDGELVHERHYFLMMIDEAPEQWVHWEQDAAGTDEQFAFSFYWLPLEEPKRSSIRSLARS